MPKKQDQSGDEQKKAKQKRRDYGSGSISLRPDGRWQAQMVLETGKRKYFYGKTKKEALDKLHQAQQEQRQGVLATGPQQKLDMYLNQWLEEVHKPTIKLSSYDRYRTILDKYLIPQLGHIRLQKLTAQQVQVFYATMLKQKLAPATVRVLHAVLRKALANAIRWHLIAKNVCDDVSLPRVVKYEIQPLTKEQAQKLLDTAKGHRLEALLTVAVMTGMRRGELLALRWQDIDFETCSLHVRHSVNNITGHGYVESEPKTTSSSRTITLPRLVMESLIVHRGNQVQARREAGPQWKENDLVFCGIHGSFFNFKQLYYLFQRLLKDAGLPHIRFHDLRHSAATIMLAMGIHPKVVQERLGHSQISMTMDIYSHVLPSMQKEVTDKLDDLFGPPN